MIAGVLDAAVGDERNAGLGGRLWQASAMAVICGMPAPVTMRVVQMEPGSDADFDGVGAGVHEGHGAFVGGDVAGHQVGTSGKRRFAIADGFEDAGAVTVR